MTVLAILAVAMLPGVVVTSHLHRRGILKDCAAVASELGLRFERPRWPGREVVAAGRRMGCHVELRVLLPRPMEHRAAVKAALVVLNDRPIAGLSARTQHTGPPDDQRFLSGDPVLDRHVHLTTDDEVTTRAVLHADTRMLLMRVVGGGRCEVSDGVVTWRRMVRDDARSLQNFVNRGVQLACRLARPLDPADRLAAIAWSTDSTHIRHEAAKALGRLADRDLEALTALRKLAARAPPALQLTAIRELGPAHAPRAFALARSDAVADHIRAGAVKLACELDAEAGAGLLEDLLATRAPPLTRIAAIDQARALGLRHAWPALAALCGDARFVAAASRALADLDASEAEPDLLRLIEEGPADCRGAIATTLGEMGTASSLPALTALAGEPGPDPSLHRAAERARQRLAQRVAAPLTCAHGAA